MPISHGIKELSCVCERCGTPFTYEIPRGYQEELPQNTKEPSPSANLSIDNEFPRRNLIEKPRLDRPNDEDGDKILIIDSGNTNNPIIHNEIEGGRNHDSNNIESNSLSRSHNNQGKRYQDFGNLRKILFVITMTILLNGSYHKLI